MFGRSLNRPNFPSRERESGAPPARERNAGVLGALLHIAAAKYGSAEFSVIVIVKQWNQLRPSFRQYGRAHTNKMIARRVRQRVQALEEARLGALIP
jgi:hypothetical protein